MRIKYRAFKNMFESFGVVQFFVWFIFAFILHGIQCNIRFYSHQVFLSMVSLQGQNVNLSGLEIIWKSMNHEADVLEIVLYDFCTLFLVWVAYQIRSSKIPVKKAMRWMILSYLVLIAVFLPLQLSNKDIVDLVTPVLISFIISVIQMCAVWLMNRKNSQNKI